MKSNHIKENVIEKFRQNQSFNKFTQLFSKFFGHFECFIVENSPKILKGSCTVKIKPCKGCSLSESGRRKCLTEMAGSINRSSRIKKVDKFMCSSGMNGFTYPIWRGDKIYAYLIICHASEIPGRETLELLAGFIDTILSDVQKELELKKLYDTIRPRAIALSTVHTLHRLISSTLNLNELLPRVARLTLQVMRAERCSIKLLDSKRKILLPKTTVDLRKKKTKLKKVLIGRWAPGKAVKYSRPVRGRDYIAMPLIDEDVIGVITVYDKSDKNPFSDFDEEILKTLCEQAVIAIRNAQLYKEQEKLTVGSIKSISAILETKAPGTYLPKASFLRIVHLIGVELKMSEIELKHLQYASMLHDAGQIFLPDRLTKKKGVLTGHEYNLIKEHPKKAAIILKPLKSLKNVVPIILHHHENYDGTGYPMGLRGNDIPAGARIMGVVGAFEAMITMKPYRKPLTINGAVDEIKKHSLKQFDPAVVQAFLNVIKRKDILKMLKAELYGSKKTGK